MFCFLFAVFELYFIYSLVCRVFEGYVFSLKLLSAVAL